MNNVIQYRFLTPYNYATMFWNCASPLMNWLAFGKLAENPVVTPTTTTQVIYPSGANKYLASVTVEATA